MLLEIYKELTGEQLDNIPDKSLWVVMKQYCGYTGESRNEYYDKNMNKEIKLKNALNIN